MFKGQSRWGKDPEKVVRCSDAIWRLPKTKAWKKGDRVMVCHWSDFFHPAADGWRKEAYEVMLSRPDIHWIVPTKRTLRIIECLGQAWQAGYHVESLTILASVENQAMATKRIPALLGARGMGDIFPRFHAGISVEPMLEAVDLKAVEQTRGDAEWVYNMLTGEALCTNSDSPSAYVDDCPKIEWVIVGAENASKQEVRHCDSHNVVSIQKDCMAAKVPVYVKQIHDSKSRLVKMPKGWPREYPDYMEAGK